MSSLDFFLRGYVKDNTYINSVCTLDEMKNTPSTMLQAVPSKMMHHAQLCIQNDDGQFQHLLKHAVSLSGQQCMLLPILCFQLFPIQLFIFKGSNLK
jgi:hypothetical protein